MASIDNLIENRGSSISISPDQKTILACVKDFLKKAGIHPSVKFNRTKYASEDTDANEDTVKGEKTESIKPVEEVDPLISVFHEYPKWLERLGSEYDIHMFILKEKWPNLLSEIESAIHSLPLNLKERVKIPVSELLEIFHSGVQELKGINLKKIFAKEAKFSPVGFIMIMVTLSVIFGSSSASNTSNQDKNSLPQYNPNSQNNGASTFNNNYFNFNNDVTIKINDWSNQYNISGVLIATLIKVESEGQEGATRSGSNETGLFQSIYGDGDTFDGVYNRNVLPWLKIVGNKPFFTPDDIKKLAEYYNWGMGYSGCAYGTCKAYKDFPPRTKEWYQKFVVHYYGSYGLKISGIKSDTGDIILAKG